MRIPDINRLYKCEELLKRVHDNLYKVLENMHKQKQDDTNAYAEIQNYRKDVDHMIFWLSGTARKAREDVPEEQWKKYNNKLL